MKKTEKSLFLKVIGESPILKVIDFLIENKGMDFCKQDIAKGSGMSRTTLFHCWIQLENAQVVIPTRKFGKTTLYKLNTKSIIVKKMLELELALVNKFIDQEAGKATKKRLEILAK